MGTVLAKVTDTSGAPVTDATVVLVLTTGTQVSLRVNQQGEALFVNVPAGTTTVQVFGWGYYEPAGQIVQVVDKAQAAAAFSLEARNSSTVVVLGSRVVAKAATGTSLEFEIDVGVLDGSGQPVTDLVDAAFEIPGVDCGWLPCFVGSKGILDAGVGAAERPASLGLVAARNRAPFAAGFLADQRIAAEPFEPQRSAAVAEFLQGLGGNDTALLAEFSGVDSDFSFTPSGGFVSDGRSLLALAQGLPDRIDKLESDPVAGIDQMLAHLAQQPSAPQRSLVAFATSAWFSCPSDGLPPYGLACEKLIERSRADGIPITTLSNWNETAAETAARSGGANFHVEYPAQYLTALRGLPAVLGGELPYYRMRFVVDVWAGTGVDPLATGNTLYVLLRVELTGRDEVYVPVFLPL